jgi:2-(1,2-epoxy-1,2-dihydrophenyl)acetyl-CoA isomerase
MSIVREEYSETVCIITLNRPERKNALSKELLSALHEALQNAQEKKCTVVVIRGSGKTFTAGGDLGEFRELVREGKSLAPGVEILNNCIILIRKMDAIVISVLEGAVVGAGIGLSMACDLSVATKSTVMNMAYRRIGLTPDGGSTVMLPRILGTKRFNDLYFLARNIGMNQAMELGLVNFVWDEEELEKKLELLIHDLLALPVETIGYFKDLVNDSLFVGLESQLDKENSYLTKLGGTNMFKDRLELFFAKK